MARKRRLTETGRWIRTELAERCGINYRVVNDVMVGCNRKPENIRRIKEALGRPGEKDAV